MSWFQKSFELEPQTHGTYLITDHVLKEVPEIEQYKVGLFHLFIQHTSAALSLNENDDVTACEDMTAALDRIAPEDPSGTLYKHTPEQLDNMVVCRI